MGSEYKLLVGDQEVLRPYQESIALARWPERWAFFGDFLLLLTKSYSQESAALRNALKLSFP